MRALTKEEFIALSDGADDEAKAMWLSYWPSYLEILQMMEALKDDETFPSLSLKRQDLFNLDMIYTFNLKKKSATDGWRMRTRKLIPGDLLGKYADVRAPYWIAIMRDDKIVDVKPPQKQYLVELFKSNNWVK